MNHKVHNVGAAEKIGRYSDAIEAAPGLRWLHTSGTPGVLDNGTFPEGIEAQTRLAWKYILAMLTKAEMTTADCSWKMYLTLADQCSGHPSAM